MRSSSSTVDMASAPVSNIALAFASVPSASIDVPKRSDASDGNTFAAYAQHAHTLLTPPNSISPSLPTHTLRPGLSSLPPIHIDSDVDLQDAVDHAAAQDQPQLHRGPSVPLSKGALSGLEATGAITPVMLATHHLPAAMLGNGPIAIRHIMAYLTQSVPGFSRIPPAKARRLVVAALESRGHGGPNGEIDFEKVGWGRWEAHEKKAASRDRLATLATLRDGNLSPPRSESSSYAVSYSGSGLQIPGARHLAGHREFSGESWTGSSMLSHLDEEMEDMNMAEHEADKMSLDSSSATSDSDPDSEGDETEEDEWTPLGPEAIRKASLPTPGGVRKNYNLLSISASANTARRCSSSGGSRMPSLPRSVPSRPPIYHPTIVLQQRRTLTPHQLASPNTPSPTNNGVADTAQTSQEREAVEALLSMGSL
ncbi:DNA-binding proteins Bright/BRCAA1/RBP1 and proteins containing BRIGHT domain [Elasticomyces elasticus]|nr:DNA-binding proteins Bright/BRCAA1/RBP1 and proteins containing BRIGHT domain [Elasticomyces elasticus]